MKGRLVDDGAAVATGSVGRVGLAVPAHAVETGLGPVLLQYDPHRVGEAHGVVGRVGRQQEHVALADDDVLEGARLRVHDLEQHGAPVLVEPLGRLVDVVVGPRVGTAYDLLEGEYEIAFFLSNLIILSKNSSDTQGRGPGGDGETCHGGEAIIIDAVIVHGRLQEMGVLLQPGAKREQIPICLSGEVLTLLTIWADSLVREAWLISFGSWLLCHFRLGQYRRGSNTSQGLGSRVTCAESEWHLHSWRFKRLIFKPWVCCFASNLEEVAVLMIRIR